MVSSEFLMFEYIEIGLIAYLMEIIHIELPDKGGEITMAEVNG